MQGVSSPGRTWHANGTASIIIGAVVAGVASLVYEVLGARYLGTEGFAPVSALLTLHFLALVVVLLPLEQVIIRRLTQDHDRPGVPVSTLGLVVFTAAATGIAAWTLRGSLFDGDGWYAVATTATVLTHGLFVSGRAYLAGRSRYGLYGIASAAAALTRLALALLVIAAALDDRAFAAAVVVGPFTIASLRPFRRSPDDHVIDTSTGESRLLAGLVLASAMSQALLLAGPVVAALLGAEAATISILFVVFTLMRAPLSLGNNVIARVVPPFTAMAAAGKLERLASIARRVGLATGALGLITFAVGAAVGPSVVTAVFGAEFRPQALATALIAGGAVAAAGSLVVGQVFVARGDTGRLADSWLTAVAIATAVLFIPGLGVMTRVAVAFLAGEAIALVLLVIQAGSPVRRDDRTRSARRWYSATKRMVDLIVAVVAAVLSLPVAAVIAVAIRIDSGGPVMLRQTRLGRGGEPFRMWKFRTMARDADPAVFWSHIRALSDAARSGSPVQPDLRIHHDPRLTRIGRSLRRWSLDELPNLLNVISGDMSLVGPRPLLPEEVDLIRAELGDSPADVRQTVPPGITGLAQVEGRDDISMEQRSRLDLRYIDERSMSLDLWLTLRTVAGVFRHRGA